MKTSWSKPFICLALLLAAFASNSPALEPSMILRPKSPLTRDILYAGLNSEEPKFLDLSQAQASAGPSLSKALLLSILLPGAGEYYAGARFKGQVFMGVEAALWTGFAGYRVYGGWKTDDYEKLASARAGADLSGKDDFFHDMIGFYNNREEYNQLARLYYPDRPYFPDNRSYDWQWDSEASRERYKQLKKDAQTAFRNSTFLVGLALANRIISVVDTYRTVKAARKKISSLTQFGEYHLRISPHLLTHPAGFELTLSRKF